MLGLLRRAFSSHVSVSAKRCLYASLVRSKLLFYSPLWHPYLLKDVKCLELVQIRATRYIINDPTLDYKGQTDSLKHFASNVGIRNCWYYLPNKVNYISIQSF